MGATAVVGGGERRGGRQGDVVEEEAVSFVGGVVKCKRGAPTRGSRATKTTSLGTPLSGVLLVFDEVTAFSFSIIPVNLKTQ